jgi:hypothetical protein
MNAVVTRKEHHMRTATLLTVSLLAGLIALPTRASAQVSATITIGVRTGTPLIVSAYSPQEHGPWQQNYRTWTPVTLYEYDGHYYVVQVRDRHNHGVGRPVAMYRNRNGYFMAPTGPEWANRGRGRGRGHDRH